MEFYWWIVIIAAIVLIPGLLMLKFTAKIARMQYENLLVRTSPDKWSRECSAPEIEEHYKMYCDGVEWANKNENYKKEVAVTSDGLKLCGEYFDFGYKKAVIIIPGRNEGLRYSYYFAPPYAEIGYNVLVIDIRAHGLSEGKYDSLGWHEQNDMLRWMELLVNDYNIEKIVLHGLCIGAATAIYTAANNDCPAELSSIILEGPFTSFYDVLKQRMKTNHKPIFPVRDQITYYIKKYSKTNIKKEAPINLAKDVNIPTLFICGREDVSSIPEKCEKLYNEISCSVKDLVWFDKGAHSHLRVNNLEGYDEAIKNFIKKNNI